MKKLFWSNDPVMSSVYASEEWVQRLRDIVGAALERAVVPVEDYLDTLAPFIEFLNLDGEGASRLVLEELQGAVSRSVDLNVFRRKVLDTSPTRPGKRRTRVVVAFLSYSWFTIGHPLRVSMEHSVRARVRSSVSLSRQIRSQEWQWVKRSRQLMCLVTIPKVRYDMDV